MDLGALLRSALALIATLGLLGLLAYAANRFDFLSLFKQDGVAPQKKLADFFSVRAPSAPRRLQIVEQRLLDPRTRLLVVRWDDVEHLILAGAGEGGLLASKPAPPATASPPARSGGDAA